MGELFEKLNKELTGEQLGKLHVSLELGQKQLTRRFSGKSPWQEKEIVLLSKIIDIPVSELILKYGIGQQVITLDEMNRLVKDEGYEVGVIAHAA